MRADGSGSTRLQCGFYAGKFKRDGFNGTRPPCKPETGRTFERALWKRDRLAGTRKLPTNRFPRGKRPFFLFFFFHLGQVAEYPSFATSIIILNYNLSAFIPILLLVVENFHPERFHRFIDEENGSKWMVVSSKKRSREEKRRVFRIPSHRRSLIIKVASMVDEIINSKRLTLCAWLSSLGSMR